jgi:hypothetical protein
MMREQYQALFVKQNERIAAEFLGITDKPLFDLSWRGDSECNTYESLTPHQVDALYGHRPALKKFHELIGSAALA